MDDSAQVPPSSIPNDEPSSPLTPPISPNPKIELPDVPVMPGEPKIDDKKEIPIVEVPDQPAKTPPIAPSAVPIPESETPPTPVVPPVVPETPESPKTQETTTDEPFLVPPKPMFQDDQSSDEQGVKNTSFFAPPIPPNDREIKRTPMKSIALGLVAIFVIAGGAFGYFFFQKGGMQVTKKATDELSYDGKLVCMPVDDEGNLTNEKYRYNRIMVINKTGSDVPVWVQDNICEYKNSPSDGYECNDYHNRWNDTVANNSSKIFSVDVPCNKTVQLDLARDNSNGPACYNTSDEKVWEGGMAFTIKSNSTVCPNCDEDPLALRASVSPKNVSPGGNVGFTFTSNTDYVNVSIDTSGGATCGDLVVGCDGDKTVMRDVDKLHTCWTWRCTANSQEGSYKAKFTGSTKTDSTGQNCNKEVTFNVISNVTPTLTPTPTLTVTPFLTACSSVSVQIENSAADLDSLKIGDVVNFKVTFSGTVEDVAVDLRQNSQSIKTFYAGGTKSSSWTTDDYTLVGTGNFEVYAFIKYNGVWQ